MAGTVFDQDGLRLTSSEVRTGPFPRSMLYRHVVRSSYDAQRPPPYPKVAVTDCRGRTSTDSINIAVAREQETAATFSPGWTGQRLHLLVRRLGAPQRGRWPDRELPSRLRRRRSPDYHATGRPQRRCLRRWQVRPDHQFGR